MDATFIIILLLFGEPPPQAYHHKGPKLFPDFLTPFKKQQTTWLKESRNSITGQLYSKRVLSFIHPGHNVILKNYFFQNGPKCSFFIVLNEEWWECGGTTDSQPNTTYLRLLILKSPFLYYYYILYNCSKKMCVLSHLIDTFLTSQLLLKSHPSNIIDGPRRGNWCERETK